MSQPVNNLNAPRAGDLQSPMAPLISTGLQPGVSGRHGASRFNGFRTSIKTVEMVSLAPTPDTRLKPGANEMGNLQTVVDLVAVLPHPGPLPLGEGATSAALVPSARLASVQHRLRPSLAQRERAGVREKTSVVLAALLFTFAFSTFAASVGELVDERLAVERVYYAKQVGAKAPFEQAVPRSVIEKRVQQELLKERVLKNVYRLEITPKLVAEEVARIERSTMAGDMLAQIKLALGNNPEKFARTVAKPLVVDRVLRARFEADATQQAGKRAEAEELRAQLLAAKADERAALLKARPDTREVKWHFGAKPKSDLASARPASLGAEKRYFADLPAEMQKVLDAQLRQPGDVSAVFGSDDSFALYVAASRTAEALTAQAVEISRLNFDDWLTAQARTNP
jgi:hypothetical protein